MPLHCTVYIGAWSQGHWHGRGVLQLKNGERYEGGFYKGQFYGVGRFTWVDGGYYEGDYVRTKGGYQHGVEFPDPDGKRNGRGVRVWVSGDKYEGEWHQDYQHGVGVLRKAAGGRFDGRFVWGQRTGPGKETWGNQLNVPFECPVGNRHEGRGYCSYEGEYRDGHFHGRGCYQCIDGRRYEGGWRRGRRHGWGVQVMIADGERGDPRRHFMGGVDALYRPVQYSGEWADGVRAGQGVLEYANGLRMCGDLDEGRFDGTVKVVWPDPPQSGGKSEGERLALFRRGARVAWLPAGAATGLGPEVRPGRPLRPPRTARGVLEDLLGREASEAAGPKKFTWAASVRD